MGLVSAQAAQAVLAWRSGSLSSAQTAKERNGARHSGTILEEAHGKGAFAICWASQKVTACRNDGGPIWLVQPRPQRQSFEKICLWCACKLRSHVQADLKCSHPAQIYFISQSIPFSQRLPSDESEEARTDQAGEQSLQVRYDEQSFQCAQVIHGKLDT